MDADKPATDSMFFACATIFLVATAMASGWGAHLVWGGLCAAYTVGGLIARRRARRQEALAQVQAEAALAAASAAAMAAVAPAAAAAPAAAVTAATLKRARSATSRSAQRAPAIAG